jgi:hypothetical protein
MKTTWHILDLKSLGWGLMYLDAGGFHLAYAVRSERRGKSPKQYVADEAKTLNANEHRNSIDGSHGRRGDTGRGVAGVGRTPQKTVTATTSVK